MHARTNRGTRRGGPFPSAVIVVLAMTLFCPSGRTQSPRGERTEEERERRYRQLLDGAGDDAGPLYRVGEWCLKISSSLSASERQRYRERGSACFRRAEARVRDELVRIFAEAESDLRKAEDYQGVVDVQTAAKDRATEYLEPLLEIFEFQNSLESFRQVIEQGSERLDEVALPFRRHEAERRVRSGEVFLEGRWHSIGRADPGIQFAGTVPLSILRKNPRDYLGQLVCTNFVGRGRVYKLLDTHFLDGLDERAEYVPPNFMTERTVLTLRADRPAWLKTLQFFRENRRSEPADVVYRFQVVVRMHERSLQETDFFDAEVQQMAIFDGYNRLVEYLGPQPGESE